MGRTLSLFLILFSFSTFALESDLPVLQYTIDSETISVHTKLTKDQLSQKKLIHSLKKVRKEFLKFMNSGEKTYEIPQNTNLDIYLFENEKNWKAFLKKYPDSQNCAVHRGCYDEVLQFIGAFDASINPEEPSITDIVTHEYVHHLVFKTLNKRYLEIAKHFPYQNISYAWPIEGIAQYLSAKALYKNGIRKTDVTFLNKYKKDHGRHMTLWEIMTTANDLLPNKQRDFRHYWYSNFVFNFLIENDQQPRILQSLERLYKLDASYCDSWIQTISENEHGKHEELEAAFQVYLETLLSEK